MSDLYEKKLKSSDLTLQDAEYLGLKLLTPQETQNFLPSAPPNPSIRIPYHDIGGSPRAGRNDRLRILDEPKGFYKSAKKFPRFLQQSGAVPQAYFPRHPNVYWIKVLNSLPKEAIYITEGELKAACAVKHGFPCLGIGGVWSWKSKAFGIELLPEFRQIDLVKRIVYLVFDADQTTNEDVAEALQQLCEQLVYVCGAHVYIVNLPEIPEHPKTGIDDFILHFGADAFRNFVAAHAKPYPSVRILRDFDQRLIAVRNPHCVLERSTLQILKYKGAKEAFSAHTMLIPMRLNHYKKVPVFTEWMQWPGKTTVQGLCFKPDEAPKSIIGDQFNLWTGFPSAPVEGSVELWHSFLNHLIPDEQERLWIERWIAWRFQNPHLKPLTALCLYSPNQGTGKTFVTQILKAVLGKELWADIDPDKFSKQFNKQLEGKLLIFVQEVYNFGTPNYSTKLKNAVTNTTINIEPKGVDSYPVDDLSAWLFTTNHPDALHLDERDRRFYVVEVTDQYFPLKKADEIEAWYKTPEGSGALLHYFRAMDLQGFDARERAPMTYAKGNMISHTGNDLRAWVADLKNRNLMELFDGCLLRTLREILTIFLSECEPDNTEHYTTRYLGKQLAENGYKKVNRGSNVTFQIHNRKKDTFWLMDPSQHQFYAYDHRDIIAYLRDHYTKVGETVSHKLSVVKTS